MNRPTQMQKTAFIDFCKVQSIKNQVRAMTHENRKEITMAERAFNHSNFFKMAAEKIQTPSQTQTQLIQESIKQKESILKKELPAEVQSMIRKDIALLQSLLNEMSDA